MTGAESFKIFDFETKKQVLAQSLKKGAASMTLTPDDKFIIFGSHDGDILMFPLEPMQKDLGKFFKYLTGFIFF